MNTQDLSKLGYREIDQLADLLKAYANNPNDCGLNDGVKWEYNPHSDCIFLTDEDCNVAMINPENGELEKFYKCPNCGNEGFKSDADWSERVINDVHYLSCYKCEKAGHNPEEYFIIL
jgi:hypothetical protein